MDPESIKKTAFITQNNQYEFLRLPFDLKNSAATFQRLMNTILVELIGKICFVYIDDIVIYSRDLATHLQHLQQVSACLQRAGLTLNLRKCQICQRSLSFLGHVISGEGIRTEAEKIEAIRTYPTPRNLKELQCFIGLAGWYHRFIPRFSERAAPLHALKKKGVVWEWTAECQAAVEETVLTTTPVLQSPDLASF